MDNEAKNWGMVAHIGGAANSFFSMGWGWIVPGIVYLLHKDKPEIAKHASEAFQFQLAMTCAIWGIGVLSTLFCFLFAPMFWLVSLGLWGASIGYGAYAGVQVSNGERFKYPLLGDELPR